MQDHFASANHRKQSADRNRTGYFGERSPTSRKQFLMGMATATCRNQAKTSSSEAKLEAEVGEMSVL